MDKNKEVSKKPKFKFKKRDGVFLIIGMLAAFLLRFALVDADVVHHHANFALYVNGVRDEFDSFTFYEEVAGCSLGGHDDPKSRVHMHGQINDVVHVHDGGSTWGAFFANLGYTLGDEVLVTDSGVFADKDGSKLTFILNGEKVSNVANNEIKSEDRLLINYGNDSDETLMSRYADTAENAHEYNEKPDPASCSGAADESLKDRFIRTLGISQKHDQSAHDSKDGQHSH